MRDLARIACVVLAASACTRGDRDQHGPSSTREPDERGEARAVSEQGVEQAVDAELIDASKPWTDAWLLDQGQRYLHDPSFRRQALEASLTSSENIYARTRLSAYGLGTRGWDLLPEWTPEVFAIDESYVRGLIAGDELRLPDAARPLWDGREPTNMSAWIELGRRVFNEYPLRGEVFAEHALRSSALSRRVGLGPDENGLWPGLVAFKTFEGATEVGITCALCHVDVQDGKRVEGRARRNFDYGEMRLAYYRETGATLEEELRRRMASWGPGRADITPDDEEDPVAIVDLWGVREHSYLTQSGTLHQVHPAALAIRQETQILHANQEEARPPRVLCWALAMYIYSLKPPRQALDPRNAELGETPPRGSELFAAHCRSCHSDASFAGPLVSASLVGTDSSLALGKARGTGRYRPAPLLDVANAAPYLHDGSVASLAALFDPQRSTPGHRYGMTLSARDRQDLITYLRTL